MRHARIQSWKRPQSPLDSTVQSRVEVEVVIESPLSTFNLRPSTRRGPHEYGNNLLIINRLHWLSRVGELEQVRGLLTHLAGAFEMRALFDAQHGCRDVPEDPGARQELHALGRMDGALQLAVDREAADLHLRVDVRVVAENQLACRPDLPLEPSIDPEGLFEREVSPDVTPLVDVAVQSRSLSPWLHRSSHSGQFFPDSLSNKPMSSSSEPNAITIFPPRRERAILTRVFSLRVSFSSAS